MSFFSQKTAVLWPSTQAVYIIKRQRNWLGKDIYYQCCIYTALPNRNWLDDPEMIQKVMSKLVVHFSLEGYEIQVAVGGTQLIWKKLSVPSKKKEEALQFALWDEMEGFDSQEYVMDVHAVQRKNQDGTYDWMLAAYRDDALRAFWQGIENAGGIVKAMDVLPAVVGRFYHAETGTYYLREEKEIHSIFIQKGTPLSYKVIKELPPEALKWKKSKDISDQKIICLSEQTGTLTWSVPLVSEKMDALQQKWQIPFPMMVLTAI